MDAFLLPIKYLIVLISRFLLWLRYDVTIKGLDAVAADKGMLFLPNHPSEMDPVILCFHLWRDFRLHPMVVEDFYHAPGLRALMKLTGAIPMPNTMTGMGNFKRMRVRQGLDRIIAHLDAGDNVLMYPAGRLMRGAREELRGTSGLFDILERRQDINIVLVRTTGFVGSSFSWIMHKERPSLARCMLNGLQAIIVNFVFFTPRRKLLIEVEAAPPDFPRDADKMVLNHWLEDWFNRYGDEPIARVSYTFWRETLIEPAESAPATDMSAAPAGVPPGIRGPVLDHLAAASGWERDAIADHHSLSADLGIDSLQTADLAAWIDESFMVSDIHVSDLRLVRDVLEVAAGEIKTSIEPRTDTAPAAWRESRERLPLVRPNVERTIQHNFLDRCSRFGGAVCVADETSGVLTYKRAKTAVLILADVIAELPETNVGIMLPAGAGTNMVIIATMLAGKVPVMINWTLGDANLEHVIRAAEIKQIISSSRFLDHVEQINIELLEEYIVLLEDVRAAKIGFMRKVKGAVNALRSTAVLCRRFCPDADVSDTAVILFTSGSESAPKGVPLTHRNIVANIAACVDAISFASADVLYGFLPPFHSFGFTVTGLLPMITGLKTAYSPNPTASRRLANGIGLWQPTVICGTPTFILGICRAARDQRLDSLRIIVTGAEKAGDELFEIVREQSSAEILEGYGITECAPVLTISRCNEPRAGVGRAVGDVEIRVVDPDDRTPRDIGRQGLILVSGSNVFGGYLDRDSSDAFTSIEGNRYYITGDLGNLDEAGHLTISGRLKRFVKIGGEMISLPAMEEAIEQAYPNASGEPQAALTYAERDGERPLLALFAVPRTDPEQVNAVLKTAGFSNLARVHRVLTLAAIPLLGTGKTDYRTLTAELKKLIESGN